MTHTYDSAPTSQQKGTMSIWYKRSEIGTNIGLWQFGDDGVNELSIRWARDVFGSKESYSSKTGGTGLTIGNLNGAVRDTAAWYHMVVAIDTTQATATNRFRVYRNGEELTWSTDNRSSITQNSNMAIGANGSDVLIGEGTYRFNGYIAEVNYVDGQQLTPSDFGEYDSDSGIWIPKKYTGTYGNNGFYLDFSNASNLGEDQSGNNHDFTLNNITSANQATDTPTNNFATYNDLLPYNSNGKLIEGATKFYNGSGGADTSISTIAVANGKWYAEFKTPSNVTGGNGMVGVAANSGDSVSGNFLGQDAWSVGLFTDGNYRINNSATSYLGSTWNNTEILSVALDMDNKKVYFAKDGTWGDSGNPATDTNGIALPSAYEDYEWFIGASLVNYTDTFNANYGGYTIISISSAETDENGYGTFEYAPPSGYYALCTKNLAEYG
jgi:hypothetical protein